MKTNERKQYEAPELTVVTFRAERGYAESGGLMSSLKFWEWGGGLAMSGDEGSHIEVYESGNGWNEGSNSFWD